MISVCGSDEHGVPSPSRPQRGRHAQQIVDRYHQLIKSSFEGARHVVRHLLAHLVEDPRRDSVRVLPQALRRRQIHRADLEQYYDEETQTFLADRYIVGTCPRCGNDRAYGDQCVKNADRPFSPDELINPHSAVSGSVPVKRATKPGICRWTNTRGFLREWILEGHKEWKTNVYGQCKSWLDGGLQPRAVSRDLDWGIPYRSRRGRRQGALRLVRRADRLHLGDQDLTPD